MQPKRHLSVILSNLDWLGCCPLNRQEWFNNIFVSFVFFYLGYYFYDYDNRQECYCHELKVLASIELFHNLLS